MWYARCDFLSALAPVISLWEGGGGVGARMRWGSAVRGRVLRWASAGAAGGGGVRWNACVGVRHATSRAGSWVILNLGLPSSLGCSDKD